MKRAIFFLVKLSAAAVLGSDLVSQEGSDDRVDFVRDIQPIFKASCYPCHGAEKQKGRLRLDSRPSAIGGGDSRKAIVPGKSKESVLITLLVSTDPGERMPQKAAALGRDKIDLIRAWIDQGANWPDSASVEDRIETHWAYLKPRRPETPNLPEAQGLRNPIDPFISARLAREGIPPSPEASREVLIRRLYLDLIGLPPSVEEVDAFVRDSGASAYESVVEHLLHSPHYGERWARLWLDLARYADTNGYEQDAQRTMWLYRDWVIDAFNKDMPFDRFTIEQIAGDLIPNATLGQRIATGFHRNTMYNQEDGVDNEEGRWEVILDRVNTTASVWLGTTLACAQCHNHKYDPFTQRDYYRLFAFLDQTEYVFTSGKRVETSQKSIEPEIELATPEQDRRRESLRVEITGLEETLSALQHAGSIEHSSDQLKERIAGLKKELETLIAQIPTALVLKERPSTGPPTTYLRIRGAFLDKGERVSAGVPRALHPLSDQKPANRLGLAYWLVDENNPLTARVMVNRLWAELFGQGIVETLEDFGTQGARPVHPELLDWLASEFMRLGWSTKALLRTIVTSATYRRSSATTPALIERDPSNRLLGRGPRFRVDAEMIRDIQLAASGLLSRKIGGPSVFPPQPEGFWTVPFNRIQWITSAGEDRYRRGIYTFWRRTSPYPAFMIFDAPSREFCTVRRIRTNTPLQSLTLLNDAASFESASGLARRMLKESGPEPRARLAFGFRLCVSRSPKTSELDRLAALHALELEHFRSDPESANKMVKMILPRAGDRDAADLAAWCVVANVLLNLHETLTRD